MNRVLIVDDQPAFRRSLRNLLTHAGMMVVAEAQDIATALDLVKELHPQLCVVDVMLPGENGLEGTARLKAINPGMKVVLVSAFHDSARRLQTSAEETGAEGFYPKDELDLDIVRKWMKML